MEKGQTNYCWGATPNSHIGIASTTDDLEASYAFAKFAATYGNKYMYASGHAGTWSGNNGDEILEVVFGSVEEAEKYVDPWGFNEYVVSAGKPAYADTNITAISEIMAEVSDLTNYVLVGEMEVEDMMEELKDFADEAIEDAQK
jgi:ABC-type glycerol-3-phosphate transport system substrate-binding protein